MFIFVNINNWFVLPLTEDHLGEVDSHHLLRDEDAAFLIIHILRVWIIFRVKQNSLKLMFSFFPKNFGCYV